MNIFSFAKYFAKYLLPHPKIGGLEINDQCLRYILLLNKNKPVCIITVPLPAGTIVQGKIQNLKYFEAALIELNNRIKNQIKFRKNEDVEIVVTLSNSSIYTADFELPQIKEKNLKEAVVLNLKIVSPLPLESTYHSWQPFPSLSTPFKINIFAAFAEKTLIDPLSDIFKKCGFLITAIEFAGFSILRSISQYYPAISSKPNLICHLSPRGVNIIVNSEKNLAFNYFYGWQPEEQSSLNPNNLIIILKREITKGLNYYFLHFLAGAAADANNAEEDSRGLSAETTSPMALSLKQTPAIDIILEGEKINIKLLISIAEHLKSAFPNKIILPVKNADYLAAWGAALRGLISPLSDNLMSLTSLNIEEKYQIKQSETLINFWGKITSVGLAFMIILFFSINLFLILPQESKIKNNKYLNPAAKDKERLLAAADLIKETQNHNQLINSALKAREFTADYSLHLKELAKIANAFSVDIIRLAIAAPGQPLAITGRASSRESVAKFKGDLIKNNKFSNIDLPIKNYVEIEKKIQFQMTLNFKK